MKTTTTDTMMTFGSFQANFSHTGYTPDNTVEVCKGFSEGVQPFISKFVQDMDQLVQLAMNFKPGCHFVSETVFATTFFLACCTVMDFRLPCSRCAYKRI